MKLIIHAGTGTVIEADDHVYVLDTKYLPGGEVEEQELLDYAIDFGRRVSSRELELNYSNCISFSPDAIRDELESTTPGLTLTEEVRAWAREASDDDLTEASWVAINNEMIWQNFGAVLESALTEVFNNKRKDK